MAEMRRAQHGVLLPTVPTPQLSEVGSTLQMRVKWWEWYGNLYALNSVRNHSGKLWCLTLKKSLKTFFERLKKCFKKCLDFVLEGAQ